MPKPVVAESGPQKWYSQLAFVTLDALGGAEALARVGIAERRMPIAPACWGEETSDGHRWFL